MAIRLGPSLLGWRPALLGLETIAIRLEAIAFWLEASAIRLESILARPCCPKVLQGGDPMVTVEVAKTPGRGGSVSAGAV